MKSIIITILITIFIGQAVAANTTGSNKATATLSATCTISSNSVNFGMLILPLTTQSATSNMTVMCNKGAPYTIDLAYGGIYGQGSPASGYTFQFFGQVSARTQYQVRNASNQAIGLLDCYTNFYGGGAAVELQGVGTMSIMQSLFGSSFVQNGTQYSNTGACKDASTANPSPTSWVGAYNAGGTQSIGSPAYSYGMITGIGKGNQLAYSIEVPGQPTKVWNMGVNSYTGTGIGTNQSISVKATLIPSKSSSSYPAPDIYQDTVTTNINF